MTLEYSWPIFVRDRSGREIYLTYERWEHALDHPGMHEGLLDLLLETLHKGSRKQDTFDLTIFKYAHDFPNLPAPYSHMVVVVKFDRSNATKTNNFVLTAYLIEKW